MPRFSFSRRPSTDMSVGGSSTFQMKDPSILLTTTSSAALTKVSDFEPHQTKGHEWQRDAFAYNRTIGEVGALHALTSELIGSCDLRVMEDRVDPETGRIVAIPSHDPRGARVMRAFVGPVGGQKELKRRAALHYQIAGESLLVATPIKDERDNTTGYGWEFLSTEEIQTERKKVAGELVTIVKRTSGYESDGTVDVEASVARWWRSDPEFSGRADSPLRRVLPLCRELLVLSEVVDAIAKSRLNAGILLIPDEISFGPDDEATEEGAESEDIDKFMADLISHLSAPISDRTSGSSLIPLLLKAPSDMIEKIKMLWLSRELEVTYQGLRQELLVRISQGLDAPPEIMGGKASLNHWSAYSVDRDFIDKHVKPIGEALCEFLTIAYLRRMLVKYEGLTPEEASLFRLEFDAGPLSYRDDESDVAAAGWDRFLISDESWITSNGFSEADAPTEEERRRRVLEKMMLSAPGLYGLVLLPVLYPELAQSMAAVQKASEAERKLREAKGAAAPTISNPAVGPKPVDIQGGPAVGIPAAGVPVEKPSGVAPVGASLGSDGGDILLERLVVAADAALSRALEKAGSRVVTRAAKSPEVQEKLKALPKGSIMANMSAADFTSLDVRVVELLGDAWDDYSVDAVRWVKEWALSVGLSEQMSSELSKSAGVRLCRRLDQFIGSGVGVEIGLSSNGLSVPSLLISSELDAVFSYHGFSFDRT